MEPDLREWLSDEDTQSQLAKLEKAVRLAELALIQATQSETPGKIRGLSGELRGLKRAHKLLTTGKGHEKDEA